MLVIKEKCATKLDSGEGKTKTLFVETRDA